MKDRQTQRAVRNILHNELGVTSEKVEQIIVDFIDNKANKIFQDYINSTRFEHQVKKHLEQIVTPIVKHELRPMMNGITIQVNMTKSKNDGQ